jgi:hypothetical protein
MITGSAVVIGRFQGTVVVTVHGELDVPGVSLLDRTLCDLIDGQGNVSVVVDLRDARVTSIDERVSVFADAVERVHRRHGGVLGLNRPPPALHEELCRRSLGRLVRAPL